MRKSAFAALGLLLCSCSPRIVERVRTEYVYKDRERVDTVNTRDSIRIWERVAGDTVRITEYRERVRYEYRYLRDTVAIHDTTAIERVKEIQTIKPLSRWQSFKIGAFPWILGAVVLLAGWTFRGPLLSGARRLLLKF